MLSRKPHVQPVHAHGSHANVLGGDVALRSLVPPILSAERLAEIAASYFD
ncbi:hypothetical protein [Roseivivax halotolerans]|nr:hypothetical protein [Roseivivax halotolerans]